MIRSCITISLVEQARGGPFVYWDDLPTACRKAQELGFDAIEIFAPSPDALDPEKLRKLLEEHNLQLGALGTGAGWVIQKLSLTSESAETRKQAIAFIRSIVDLGGQFGAPAIIGSMQGRWTETVNRSTAMHYLVEALDELGHEAARFNVPLIYEPLNRYETNLVNRQEDGVMLLQRLHTRNVKLLADLFHMNIEEANLPAAIHAARGQIGHVHFVDSNRRAAGAGHLDLQSIADALKAIDYDGYASAEAFPLPDSDHAARMTIDAFHKYFE